MKEQLTEMTGLSARVIRVWFQNKRCKEKKKLREVTKDHQKLGYGAMGGIPMVATSPVRQDSPLGVSPLDITGYHPPWKQLTEFALRPDSEHGPQFSSLVNQMHGYDPHYVGVGGHDVYPGHPDIPLMSHMLPYNSPDTGPPFHVAEGPPGDDFTDHQLSHSQIETKV